MVVRENALQIEEKYWAHRRGSDVPSEGAGSFAASFTLTPIQAPTEHPPVVPSSPFSEEGEEHVMAETHTTGAGVFFRV